MFTSNDQPWTTLHGPFIPPKQYDNVPKFGGQDEEEIEEDFYEPDINDEPRKEKKENDNKPLKLADLKYLKL